MNVKDVLAAANQLNDGDVFAGTQIPIYREPKDGLEYRLKAALNSMRDSLSANVLIEKTRYEIEPVHFIYTGNHYSGRKWWVLGEFGLTARNVLIIVRSNRNDEVTAFHLGDSDMIPTAIARGVIFEIGAKCISGRHQVSTSRRHLGGWNNSEFTVTFNSGLIAQGGYNDGDYGSQWLATEGEDITLEGQSVALEGKMILDRRPSVQLDQLDFQLPPVSTRV